MTSSRLVFVTTSLLFLGLTTLVTAYSTFFTLDARIESTLFSLRDENTVAFFKAVTVLGNTSIVSLLTLLLSLYFFQKRQLSILAGLLVSVIGSSLNVFILKGFIERARPSPQFATLLEPSFSYPSGHATIAVALYGFLAFVLLAKFRHMRYQSLFVSILFGLILLIGFSRLYLGVHYLSDVVAGFALGTLWVMVGIHILRLKSKSSLTTR